MGVLSVSTEDQRPANPLGMQVELALASASRLAEGVRASSLPYPNGPRSTAPSPHRKPGSFNPYRSRVGALTWTRRRHGSVGRHGPVGTNHRGVCHAADPRNARAPASVLGPKVVRSVRGRSGRSRTARIPGSGAIRAAATLRDRPRQSQRPGRSAPVGRAAGPERGSADRSCERLATQAEALNQRAVTLDVDLLKVAKQSPTLAHQE